MKTNPKFYLDVQELSALENESIKGGAGTEESIEIRKEKKKEVTR